MDEDCCDRAIDKVSENKRNYAVTLYQINYEICKFIRAILTYNDAQSVTLTIHKYSEICAKPNISIIVLFSHQ